MLRLPSPCFPKRLQGIAAAVLLPLAAACAREPAAPEAAATAAVEVEVCEAIAAPLRRSIPATGTLFADEDMVVAAKVGGRLLAVHADLGDEVAAGGLLASIDPVDAELLLQERRHAFDESLTRLGLREADLDGEPDPHALPAVQRARRQADNARSRVDRAKALLQGTAVISEQDYADLATASEVAEQDHRLAVLAGEAAIAEARTLRAQLRSAEQQLADTRVAAPPALAPAADRSPSSPRERRWAVAERFASAGSLVAPGTRLFRLVDSDPLKLRVAVPEHRASAVRLGSPVEVRAEGETAQATGRISRIAPVVDPRTRAFEVEVLVPNPDRRLRPGGFARAAIESATLEEAILVPADAVISFAGVEKVLLVEGGSVAERRIETGSRLGELVEVVRGVRPGAVVVRSPPPSLLSGHPVSIAATRPIAPPPQRSPLAGEAQP